MCETDLRRIGRARFDNLELLWDYNTEATLRKPKVPLLKVLAAADREAPVATTRTTLQRPMVAGKAIDAYVFPDTDHGMLEFQTNANGSRTPARITEGYLRLLADWVKGDARGAYGQAQKLR